jgi:hypothetical protein
MQGYLIMHIKFEAETPIGTVQFSGDVDDETQKALIEFAIITLWMTGKLDGNVNITPEQAVAMQEKEKETIN